MVTKMGLYLELDSQWKDRLSKSCYSAYAHVLDSRK